MRAGASSAWMISSASEPPCKEQTDVEVDPDFETSIQAKHEQIMFLQVMLASKRLPMKECIDFKCLA